MSRRTIILLTVLLAIPALWYAKFQYDHPYGWSHSCDKNLLMSLQRYAMEHDGWYPRGEATSEGSLGLLYPVYCDDFEILRGKTVPRGIVQKVLTEGGRLTPETCGWNYLQGLRMDDDPRLALFWDKVGLDHNGGRLSEPDAHDVHFVNGDLKYIHGPEWQGFLKEQERLRAEIKRKK